MAVSSHSPMRSVPSMRTARKQKGKSRADRPRYTPTAEYPYSLDSDFSRAESDGLVTGAAALVKKRYGGGSGSGGCRRTAVGRGSAAVRQRMPG